MNGTCSYISENDDSTECKYLPSPGYEKYTKLVEAWKIPRKQRVPQ